MQLTIGIKAFNEEKHIAESISSAIQAGAPFQTRIILADSGSTDRTIEIASKFDIDIVQLAKSAERSPGVGAQLAFQYSSGDYFYMLDGDMILDREFLTSAIEFLDSNEEYAAVGGQVREMNAVNSEFRIRSETFARGKSYISGDVDRLDGGGLYRTSAIAQVGYFSDQNLHAFEEFDLAARLLSKGWKLARIDKVAVYHFGHTINSYHLLYKRIRSGNSGAVGQIVRGSLFQPHFNIIIRNLSHIRNAIIVWLWLCILIILTYLDFDPRIKVIMCLSIAISPLIFLAFRRKSLSLGLYSLTGWLVNAFGLIPGLFRKRVSPKSPIRAIFIKRQKTSHRQN